MKQFLQSGKSPNGLRLGVCTGLFLAMAVVGMVALRCGSMNLSVSEIATALFSSTDSLNRRIVFQLRLPRVLLGMLVGAGFAISGTILQGVMRNPLASPDIIGVSAGGGLAGILVILSFPQFSFLLIPTAFLGALATAGLVYFLAWKRGASPLRLILSGVAVSAMLGACTSAVLLFHAEKAGGILDFAIGSLAGRSWPQLEQVLPYMIFGFAGAFALSRKLNVLALGDEIASGLGLRVEIIRLELIATAALLAASAVSAAGMLGFVGLIAPHIVRLLMGADHRFLLPGAACFGGILTVGCDAVGRTVMAPTELPAGILMALLGPPFFLWLLRRNAYAA